MTYKKFCSVVCVLHEGDDRNVIKKESTRNIELDLYVYEKRIILLIVSHYVGSYYIVRRKVISSKSLSYNPVGVT